MKQKNMPVKRILEALLFASSEPLSLRTLADYVPECEDIESVLLDLQNDYQDRGIHLKKITDKNETHWAFRTSDDLAGALSLSQDVQKHPSRAAMETLAIIAYHQPITKTEIETVRGVATGKGTFDTLIEAGWIKPGRRRETPGRPLTWITTSDFLDHFNLESIKDLPGVEELKSAGMLDPRPALDIIPEIGELFSSGEDNAEDESEDNRDDIDHNDNHDGDDNKNSYSQQKRAAS